MKKINDKKIHDHPEFKIIRYTFTFNNSLESFNIVDPPILQYP